MNHDSAIQTLIDANPQMDLTKVRSLEGATSEGEFINYQGNFKDSDGFTKAASLNEISSWNLEESVKENVILDQADAFNPGSNFASDFANASEEDKVKILQNATSILQNRDNTFKLDDLSKKAISIWTNPANKTARVVDESNSNKKEQLVVTGDKGVLDW